MGSRAAKRSGNCCSVSAFIQVCAIYPDCLSIAGKASWGPLRVDASERFLKLDERVFRRG